MVLKTLRDVAAWLDIAPATLKFWEGRGCPGFQNRRYDVQKIVRWLVRERSLASPPKKADPARAPDEDDVLLALGSSPALERYREARARIAELQADEAEGTYVNVARMQAGLQRMAAILRDAGDRLQKRHGPDAKALLDEHLDAFEALIPEIFGGRADNE